MKKNSSQKNSTFTENVASVFVLQCCHKYIWGSNSDSPSQSEISGTPTWLSSLRSCCDTPGCVIPNCAAVRVKWPVSANVVKVSNHWAFNIVNYYKLSFLFEMIILSFDAERLCLG